MRTPIRAGAPAAVAGAFALALLPSVASGQCATLGTPGQTGCGLDLSPAPSILCTGSPTVGNASFGVFTPIACLQMSPVLLLGACASPPVPIPGPFGTNAFCSAAPLGCTAFVAPPIFLGLPGIPAATGFTFPIPIPNDPSLVGVSLCAQGVSLCVLFVGTCVGVSNGLSITIL